MLPATPHWKTAILVALLAAAIAAAFAENRVIYPAPEQAETDLAAGLKAAAIAHKRVIVDFGGNWCGDCQVLDLYFHDPNNKPLLEGYFVLVHVNIGQMDRNLDIAARYHIPVKKGVPALAVLGERGEVLYAQRSGEFEAMRHMESGVVTRFLDQWKSAR